MSKVRLTLRLLPDGLPFTVSGRIAWALEQLIGAGSRGCTLVTHPAPRWSHYVHMLRKGGIEIETVREPHGGPFPSMHARYVLRSHIKVEQAWSVIQ